MLSALQRWREANHRRVVEQSEAQFLSTIAILLAMVVTALGLSTATGASMVVNVALIFAMGGIVGFMLSLLAVRARGRSNQH